jgi:choline dehydrogenase
MVDYIIVGAGSAGCVLAHRLSEERSTSVLLLEAGGPDKQREIHIPAAFSKLFKGPCDWALHTEEQAHLHNRRLYWPRGKVVGGSSSINAMLYIRGNRQDYDEWHDLGNKGWNFAGVLPYFKKAQNQERGASEYHGTGGPLNVADLRTINPLARAFVEAATEVGLPFNADFNGAEQLGVGYYQVTQRRGQRHSAAAAYIKPALDRPNLTVRTDAAVTRLLFDKKRVTGVRYVRNGHVQEVSADKGVILCGGAVHSPHLLLLSGIGPADHLKDLQIPVVVDLPGVGQNLQDHLAVGLNYSCTQPISLASAETLRSTLRYLLFRRGPLTSSVAESGGFVQTQPGLSAPDVQFHFAPVYYVDHGATTPEGHGFSLGPTLLRPLSRGSISLGVNNVGDPPPRIQPNYLASAGDLQTLVEGVKLARRILQAKPFDAFRGEEVTPGPHVQSDDAIAEFIRSKAETIYHPVGSCKMGSDPLAVVDSRLRVHGVEGLRVVDASVMPNVIRGNTNAPTIMIAEKAADLIKQDR